MMNLSRRKLFRLGTAALASPLLAADGGPRPAKSGMMVRSARPEDLEMPPAGFLDYITPVEHFFVRSHHYEPRVDAASWRLEIKGLVANPVSLTLDELKKMPRTELIAVCECAGNGRAFYSPNVPGLQWRNGSVGNARWTGVRLSDLLKRAGVKPGAVEVLMDGADVPVGTMPKFQRTIPLAKALDPDTILAYEMNGATLPNQHGFPLRLIAPGWASDSWVKWLGSLTLIDKEFDGFFMKTAYRHPGKPVKPGEAVDPSRMSPVTSLHVKSVIASPADGADSVPGKPVQIAGAAWAGDKGPVTAVDVSTDGGRTWTPARLGSERSRYGWRLFSHEFTPKAEQYYTLMSRARTANDIQPFAQEWNPSGYSWNVVQTVGLNVAAKPAVASSTPPQPVTNEFPAGYRQSCLGCHGEDVIQQQKLTRAQWQREIDKMVRWGSPVNDSDREGILKYLADHFGPGR